MLKFTRSTDGTATTYNIYDGHSTIMLQLIMLTEVVSYDSRRYRLTHDTKRDIPEMVSIIKDLGLHIKDHDYNTVRDMVEDMYDISAIKVAEMYCNKQ